MKALLGCLLLSGPLAALAQEPPPLDEAFARGVLVIDAEQACLHFDIYLALSRSQQRRGLMYVRELPETTGMLFVYSESGYLSMWMKNTFIPLDMLFVRSDGTVASIVRDTEPQSLASVAAEEPVRYVLELNAGTASRLGIAPGSRLFLDAEEYLAR